MPMSTRFVVAVHILTGFAVSDGKPMRSEEIAYSVNTSAVVIRGLLARLGKAGLTKSQLGNGGGTMLAKHAANISLLHVYETVEDTAIFSLHRTLPCKNCTVGSNILEAIQPILTRAREALEQELAKTTIADVGAELTRLGKFSIPLIR